MNNPANIKGSSSILTLTSLRFFFAFFVFLSHLTMDFDNQRISWLQRNLFYEGFLGVSFFFILSGFVLTYSTAKYISKDNIYQLNKKKFYLARIFRIYPLHILTLLITVAISPDFDFSKFIAMLFLVHSFIPDIGYYFAYDSPSWSISDEMFFYIVFPFLVPIVIKRPKTSFLLIILLAMFLIMIKPYVPFIYQKFVYYINPITRLLDFFLGIMLYFVYSKIKNRVNCRLGNILEITSIIVFILFFMTHFWIDKVFRYSIYYWIPMSFIILAFSLQKGRFSKILQNKILVYLGEISFAFYLIHLIVRSLYLEFNLPINIFITPFVWLTTSLLLSSIIFEFFEKPINQYLKTKLIK